MAAIKSFIFAVALVVVAAVVALAQSGQGIGPAPGVYTPGVGPTGQIISAATPNTTATVTISIATPAVITWTANGLSLGAAVTFTTSGALPTGLTSGTPYYVASILTANTFTVSAVPFSGTLINTSGTQSGTQTGTASVTLTTATSANLAAVNLSAGDWNCVGQADYALASATATHFKSGLSATSATIGATDTFIDEIQNTTTLSDTQGQTFTLQRLSLAATTPEFLVGQATFSAGAVTGYGSISCQRTR